jgi:transposase
MAKSDFRPYIPNQTLLFPSKIDEDIAANDPVRVVSTYMNNIYSCRKIEKLLLRDIHFSHIG